MSLPRRAARSIIARQTLLWTPVRHLEAINHRSIHSTSTIRNIPQWPNPPVPQPTVTPLDSSDPIHQTSRSKGGEKQSWWKEWMSSASFQAALTTVVGLGMVFGAGVGYLEWYKAHVLHRMMRAFEPGYDPALELSTLNAPNSEHVRRKEQPLIDSIVRGEHAGGYYLIVGPKGCGKGTMVLDAMRKNNADGSSILEAHPDLEVFRLRLGKALDFDYFEDWQGSLFSRADPRNGGPSLDVERAMNKLEKVALRYARKNGRPLVLAFNNIHLFPNTPEGHGVLHQLQTRAEAWAEGGIMTMIFSSDDFWPLDMMRKNASRMRVVSVYDLSASESMRALRHLRRQHLLGRSGSGSALGSSPVGEEAEAQVEIESDEILSKVYQRVGGRTSYLAKVSRADDMLEEAENMIEMEKGWLLSKIGLIPEMDDDVMDEQKWASCSWLLLRHMAQEAPALEVDDLTPPGSSSDNDDDPATALETLQGITDDKLESTKPVIGDLHMPRVAFDDARRIMTRTDFLEPLDHLHIIAIDRHHCVRPDSVLMLRAAQRVVAVEGFDEMLDQTRDRVDEIEGLHRQSELTVKEPFRISVNREAGRTVLDVVGLGGSFVPADPDSEDGEGADGDGDGTLKISGGEDKVTKVIRLV